MALSKRSGGKYEAETRKEDQLELRKLGGDAQRFSVHPLESPVGLTGPLSPLGRRMAEEVSIGFTPNAVYHIVHEQESSRMSFLSRAERRALTQYLGVLDPSGMKNVVPKQKVRDF